MIQVEHLTKRFGLATAVEDVSFEVGKGEILGFLGPNGAGKTTTMRVLAGFFPPSSGRASVAGFDVFEQPLEAKKRVGYMPENPPLYTEMAVDEFLRFVGRIKGLPSDRLEARLQEVKELCGLQGT
ncbi:MAG TPA: ABC transporter ATP-binding protein, partial [Acidobacteriota bacterium]|nr:ABC transporter ATP-binding protein [Acidobacteriota bacterium]